METVTVEDSAPKSSIIDVASWTAFLLALGCLSYIGLYIPAERQHSMRLFADFEVELPTATVRMLAIPDVAFYAFAIAFAATAVAIQWFARSKYGAVLYHAIIVMICSLILVTYREMVFSPLAALVQSLQ
jgi:hypothetical protein